MITETKEIKAQKKIYCANCSYCRVIKKRGKGESKYTLNIKCEQFQWNTKRGAEKTYSYHTVLKRTMRECEFYESMGSEKEYLEELRRTLPLSIEVYNEKE